MVNPTASVDIRIEVNTAESDNAKASELSFMLQTLGQSLPFELTKVLLAEQAELKKMPGLAKKITEYQPQPDPIAQEKAQLENEKLKAEIAEKYSRAEENKVADIRAKEAKSILDQAKAREIHGKADATDLQYVNDSSGKTHAEAVDLENIKSRNKIIEENAKPQTQGVTNA